MKYLLEEIRRRGNVGKKFDIETRSKLLNNLFLYVKVDYKVFTSQLCSELIQKNTLVNKNNILKATFIKIDRRKSKRAT